MNVAGRNEYNRPTREYNSIADEQRWEARERHSRPSERDRLQLAPAAKEQAAQNARTAPKKRSGALSTVVIAILIFGAFSFLVYRYQAVYADESRINDLKNQIEELTLENEKLETQIAISEDIEEIRSRASDELNMDFPDSGQVRKVELSEAQELATEDKTETEASGGVDILALIKSFFE